MNIPIPGHPDGPGGSLTCPDGTRATVAILNDGSVEAACVSVMAPVSGSGGGGGGEQAVEVASTPEGGGMASMSELLETISNGSIEGQYDQTTDLNRYLQHITGVDRSDFAIIQPNEVEMLKSGFYKGEDRVVYFENPYLTKMESSEQLRQILTSIKPGQVFLKK